MAGGRNVGLVLNGETAKSGDVVGKHFGGHIEAAHRLSSRLIAAYEKGDAVCLQQVDQLGRRMSAVEQQQYIAPQLAQRVCEYGELGFGGRMHAGLQLRLGAGQVQREQPLVVGR